MNKPIVDIEEVNFMQAEFGSEDALHFVLTHDKTLADHFLDLALYLLPASEAITKLYYGIKEDLLNES